MPPRRNDRVLQQIPGSYQEDRLRNDWLLLLGQRRDWTRFAVTAPNYRMNDDREVRCYTLAMEHILAGVDLSDDVKTQWYAQKKVEKAARWPPDSTLPPKTAAC